MLRSKTLLAIALASSAFGCKAKPGDACKLADATCGDGDNALLCIDGKLTAATCKGPDHCTGAGATLTCDLRGNAAGDPCVTPARGAEKIACAPDGKSRVDCKDGKVALTPCDGPKGCVKAGDKEICDQKPRFHAGDPCKMLLDDVCAEDGKGWLSCKSGKYAVAAVCGGPTGCGYLGIDMTCDTTIGVAGDACNGGETCTADGKTLLACRDAKLVAVQACPGPNGCTKVSGSTRVCDAPAEDAGKKGR